MAGKLEARQKIADFARTLVGSHYLWGSTGGVPGMGGGSYYREIGKEDLSSIPVNVAPPSLDPRSPCVKAAECNASGHYVCAGRFRKAGGSIINDPTDQDLLNFLADCRQVGSDVRYVPTGPTATWQSLFQSRLTPRVIQGSDIQDLGGTVVTGRTVWGEDCSHVRHFDCLGFIHYVLNHTTKKYFNSPHLWIGAISDYHKDAITEEVDKTDPPVPGDILFRGSPSKDNPDVMTWHHIGFLYHETSNGTDVAKVVQAEMAVTGVHDTEPYNQGASWTDRRRLKDVYLP